MIKLFVGAVLATIWIFLLRVMRKADLKFWRYVLGSAGLFVIGIIYMMPILTEPLARLVALLAAIPGKLFDLYSVYYKYSLIMIESKSGVVSLKIDFECSGIIEILAFVALLFFYDIYSVWEKTWVVVSGVLYIMIANALRITVIALMIYHGGISMYYIAHTFVGRLVFYGLSILLYFYAFTRPHIKKQRVGTFKYDVDK